MGFAVTSRSKLFVMVKDWEERLSRDGRIYFYHRKTGETQWHEPSLPNEPASMFWERDISGDGFFNTKTKEFSKIRPPDYTDTIESIQKYKASRAQFFQMLSSTVKDDDEVTPQLHTMKEASVRFDTDPRMVTIQSDWRERFLDEWITLERERRANERMKTVLECKERLRADLESASIPINTKWHEVIPMLKNNPNWKKIMNYDRLDVFQTFIMDKFSENARKDGSIEGLTALSKYTDDMDRAVFNRTMCEIHYKLKMRMELAQYTKSMSITEFKNANPFLSNDEAVWMYNRFIFEEKHTAKSINKSILEILSQMIGDATTIEEAYANIPKSVILALSDSEIHLHLRKLLETNL